MNLDLWLFIEEENLVISPVIRSGTYWISEKDEWGGRKRPAALLGILFKSSYYPFILSFSNFDPEPY